MAVKMNYLTTILLVDDDEKDCAELKNLLVLSGYRVIDADNGRDAAAVAREFHPDLLLVNLCAPLLYEMVAARLIVKNAQLGDLPVVLLAKSDDAEVNTTEMQINRNEYVARVADYEHIEQLLNYLLPSRPLAA